METCAVLIYKNQRPTIPTRLHRFRLDPFVVPEDKRLTPPSIRYTQIIYILWRVKMELRNSARRCSNTMKRFESFS